MGPLPSPLPLGLFPEIYPFWLGQASLRKHKRHATPAKAFALQWSSAQSTLLHTRLHSMYTLHCTRSSFQPLSTPLQWSEIQRSAQYCLSFKKTWPAGNTQAFKLIILFACCMTINCNLWCLERFAGNSALLLCTRDWVVSAKKTGESVKTRKTNLPSPQRRGGIVTGKLTENGVKMSN